jgi:hypothetical protein
MSTVENGSDYLAVVPRPEDEALFVTRHSVLSWPTPFDFNFMTGHSPSCKRQLHYQLLWKTPSGANLQMLWRYEQFFYPGSGWGSGFVTREGTTGLIMVDIKK